jgi:hypothetical protein
MGGDAVQKIVAGLTPYIGEHMARSAASAHCQKLGISDGKVTPEQLEQLVLRLEKGLHVFIGREKSAAVMAAIRQGLASPS